MVQATVHRLGAIPALGPLPHAAEAAHGLAGSAPIMALGPFAHDAIILGGFIVVELIFHQIEHWWKHNEDQLRTSRRAIFIAWLCHPAALTGTAEWANHMIAAAVTTFAH